MEFRKRCPCVLSPGRIVRLSPDRKGSGSRWCTSCSACPKMHRVGSPAARAARSASERMNTGTTPTHCFGWMPAAFRETGKRRELPRIWRLEDERIHDLCHSSNSRGTSWTRMCTQRISSAMKNPSSSRIGLFGTYDPSSHVGNRNFRKTLQRLLFVAPAPCSHSAIRVTLV